ncbi:MAG: hypothetical protein HeimC2_20060 [Candidatus Heimdallarchaeota archaeon LC_2]|nr:MAG: hypothetical protein HeimC2_20060 [Candidatus Heimdallarchaeota archaeon LC_2]
MMSNLSLETVNKPEIETKNHSIVDLFHAYCSHEFGSESWSDLMKLSNFSEMINHYQPRHGDSIFSVLADIACEVRNIEIKTLLSDFSTFINKYY